MDSSSESLSDRALHRLQNLTAQPDVTGTRYRLLREAGRGGMGIVYLAEDTTLERHVALKVLQIEEPQLLARLEREAKILARLEHPNIVPLYDAGALPDGRLFYTMKFVEGDSLAAYCRRAPSLPDRLRLFEKLCEGVAFAHSRGILHCDLKPGNIMVGPFGELWIMDWGLARLLSNPPEADGIVAGTPAFMAPEQARGASLEITERADIYALGAILRFLLDTPRPAPKPLLSIARKATAPAPSARYPSASELGAEVARFLDGLPVLAHPESIPEKISRFLRRNREWLLLILVYLLIRSLLLLRLPARP